MNQKYKNLTHKKQKFISYLKILTLEKPSPEEIIKDLSISLSTFYRWLNNEELLEIANIEKQKDFEEGLPDVLQILKKKALQGDMKAIKLYLDIFENIKDLSLESLTPDEMITLIKNIPKEEKRDYEYEEEEREFNRFAGKV